MLIYFSSYHLKKSLEKDSNPHAQAKRRKILRRTFSCKKCSRWFRNKSGFTKHTNAFHPVYNERIRRDLGASGSSVQPSVDNGLFVSLV